MIRRSCPTMASSLLSTNTELHKREISGQTTHADLGAANASLAKGLTMRTVGPIDIKIGDVREDSSRFVGIPQRMQEDQGAGRGSFPKNTDGSILKLRGKVAITLTNYWCGQTKGFDP